MYDRPRGHPLRQPGGQRRIHGRVQHCPDLVAHRTGNRAHVALDADVDHVEVSHAEPSGLRDADEGLRYAQDHIGRMSEADGLCAPPAPRGFRQ